MNIRVKFLGAAGEVTGSKYLLQIDEFNLLLDCGLFQGRKQLQNLNWSEFPIDPASIDAVVLTHAHLDHTGYLPRLFRQGYRGPVYCTTATADLMNLILMDSAKIQVEEARYAKKKGYSEHEDPQPLYTPDDVATIADYLETTVFEKPVRITENISADFFNAGHILGAAIVELTVRGEHETKKIVFSGDLGRSNDPILYPPHIISQADVLFVESTYGDRENTATPREEILEMMNATFERDGNLIIPAFAIGRTQNLLIYIKNILYSKEIPNVRVVVDSPMSISATEFYRKHQNYHKLRGVDLDEDESFMNLRKYLTVVHSSEESKKVNEMKHDTIIIASSGMMTGGRILHHLINRLPNPDNVVMISGYQAEGSRGRRLQDGEESIRIYGQDVPVRAKIFNIKGLSGHADRSELLHWLDGFKHPPQMTFVVHGEKGSAGALCETLKSKGWNAHVPHYLETVELFKHI
ncbi:MAG TPA: MBL fold metallo-hydrolase [Chitinophagaceae bacterium]|nr:MBL fold metallo-hydrolase [Chitinophagaceae bacterium]